MKQIKRKKLPLALFSALGAGVALSVLATGASAQQAQRVEKIEVTGSNIKRVDAETVAPVEIITREQIERTGQPTVADVLRNIPANTGGSFGESFSNSFAPGASGISLRGLGQKTTLVLLNGRRTSGYGFAQNLQDTFVDLNSIPSAAVERIEILKDGASAIYGSDAIAGVVNIILRKSYKGVEVGGGVGYSEGAYDYRFNATAGWGDLARDRWAVFATFDYFKREHLLLSDTDFGASRDYRTSAGGRNFQSLTAGGTFSQLSATGALTNNRRAISECGEFRGTRRFTSADAVAAGLLASTSALNLPDNTFCGIDINSQLSALPETERFGFITRGTLEFSPNATGYVELGLSQVSTFQVFTTPFFAGTTGLEQTAAGLRPFTYNVNFAPGSAGNPFPTNARFAGNLQDFPTRDSEITSDSLRVLAGLTYTVRSWDLDSAVGYSRNEVESVGSARLSLAGTSAALGISATRQPPIPLSTNSQINLDRPSLTPQSVRDSLSVAVPRQAESELKFVDTKASSQFGNLSGGPIGLAIGGEYREESLKDRPSSLAQTGGILGQGITATDGKRDNYALYAEVSLPITRALEAQLAGRYDRYSDYGSSTTPKVGLKYKAGNSLLFRANWGKGFRAPTLPEISPSSATFFTQVNDPVTGQNNIQISGVFAGNPDLVAEKSKSITAGMIFEPNQNFSAGVNYYRIDWKNIVASQSFQTIVNNGDPSRVIRDPETNNIVTVLSNYFNLNSTITSGYDLEARYRMSTEAGRLTFRGNMAYVHSFKEDGVEYAGSNGGSNTIPRVKSQLAVDWDVRALALTAAYNYIRHYRQDLLSPAFFTPQDPRIQPQVFPARIPSYQTYDIFAKYQFTKNLALSAAILNVSNQLPPLDFGFSATSNYDFSQYDVRGRQFRLGLTFKM